jgi:predicted ester cyclase
MSTEENKALVRRFFEDGWNKQNLALVDELLSADYVDHDLPPGFPPTRDGFKQSASMYWSGFPDGRLEIEDQVAEGDRVVTRWSGRATHTGEFMQIAPTGKQVAVAGITINRVAGGKLVENWLQFDRLGLLQQLGVVPAPGQTPAAAR